MQKRQVLKPVSKKYNYYSVSFFRLLTRTYPPARTDANASINIFPTGLSSAVFAPLAVEEPVSEEFGSVTRASEPPGPPGPSPLPPGPGVAFGSSFAVFTL